MWDVKACRGCLAVKGKLEKIGDAFKRLYATLTGLQISDCDGYPNYFCVECRTQLKKCLAFRRKSRRAHFVMKEIMTVRKQVTYSDIVTVNRKKTNLESSLNFWEPLKTRFLIMNEDDPEQNVLIPETSSTYNTRIVDIKPDIETIEAFEAKEAEESTAMECTAMEENTAMDENLESPDIGNDDDNDQELLNVDLNDVFKDLNDNIDAAESDIEIEPPKRVVKQIEQPHPEDIFEIQNKKLTIPGMMKALEICSIRVLSLEEQKLTMDVRRRMEPFYHAQYKCSMCLTIHNNMEGLVKHVEFHNLRRTGQECQVCKNKFPSVEELNMHIARCHMYEYKCKCDGIQYCLYDIVQHCRTCKANQKRDMPQKKRTVYDKLQIFTITALTQAMMKEMQAMRPITPALEARRQEPKFKSWKNLKCDICGIWLYGTKLMQKHMILSHKYRYTCNECMEVFTKRSHAIKHAATHKKKRVCPECGMSFDKLVSLSHHRAQAHDTKIPCNVCGTTCKSRHAHFNHQLLVHKYISLNDPLVGDPQFKCADCGVQFMDKRALERHVVTAGHAGADDVAFACVPCRKIFENEDQLETHFITCVLAKKYPRKCCYCEEILTDSIHYKTHFKHQHPTLQYRYIRNNAICELCGKSIFRPQLEAHLKAHRGASFECRHCGAAHAAASAHVLHVLSAHAARPYCCTLCERRFQHRSDCKDHILKVHAPAKLYKCEFCGFEFSYFRHLKDHSEKMHNLVLPHLKPKPIRSRAQVYVYAHMKIEISLLEKEIVEQANIQMLDYLDQKSKPVEYKDFFKFNSEADEYIVRIDKSLRRKKKIRTPKSKIKIESDVLIAPAAGDELEIEYKVKKEPKIKMEIGSELENAVRGLENELDMKREVMERDDMEYDTMERDVPELEIMEQEVTEQEVGEGVSEVMVEGGGLQMDADKPLEVIEQDGIQYVMIGGQLYRIACDDEELD